MRARLRHLRPPKGRAASLVIVGLLASPLALAAQTPPAPAMTDCATATPGELKLICNQQAPEDLVEQCGHPKNAQLHLVVTPISGCDGFEPASR